MKTNSFLYLIYTRLKILYLISTLFISMQNLRNINAFRSEITLVIKGPGEYFFLNSNFNPEPYEIIINGEISNCKRCCHFT